MQSASACRIINPVLSLVDTAVVGMRSATDLAALGPGTLCVDYATYVFSFLAVAGAPTHAVAAGWCCSCRGGPGLDFAPDRAGHGPSRAALASVLTRPGVCGAVTNMLAVAFARRDKPAARRIISEGLSMALGLGVALGALVFFAAPSALQRLAAAKSAELIAPALTYTRIRCVRSPLRALPRPATQGLQRQVLHCSPRRKSPLRLRRCLGIPAAMLIFVTEAYFLAATDPYTPLQVALGLLCCCAL